MIPGSVAVLEANVDQEVDSRLIKPYCKPQGLIGITSNFCHVLEPIRPISKADREIQFALPDLGASFVNLQKIKMYVRGSLTRSDGARLHVPLPGDEDQDPESVNIADNFVHTLFENVTLLLGRNQIEIQHCNYPFKAFVKQLSSYHEKTAEMEMACMTVDSGYLYDEQISLAKFRYPRIAGSVETEFSDLVLLDLFNCDSLLVPAFPIKIRFRRSPPSFYTVKDGKNDKSYTFNIHEMTLKIPCVHVQPDIMELLSTQLDAGVANYYFKGLNMMQFNLNSDTMTGRFRCFSGKVPSKMLVTFYTQESFLGADTKLPLLTHNLDVQNISLSINSVVVRQFNVNWGEHLYLDVYEKFLEHMGVKQNSYFIKYDDFKHGYRYYSFCLNEPPEGVSTVPAQALQQAFMDISFTLRSRPGVPCLMVLYYESPECLAITKDMQARYEPLFG